MAGSNKQFVKFLNSYGPYEASAAIYDERVLANSMALGVKPFEFELRKIGKYKQAVLNCIDKRKSKVFLFSGQAGDGKTHLLRMIFTEILVRSQPDCTPEQIDLIQHTWQTILKENNHNVVIEKDFSITQTSNEDSYQSSVIYRLDLSKLVEDTNLKLHMITDLSEVENLEDKQAIFRTIERIVKRSLDASANDSDCDIFLIAGNNGRILSTFNDYIETPLLVSTDDEAVCNIIKELQQSIENHMILNEQFRYDFLELHSLSDTLDREAVERIFTSVLSDEQWPCDSCPCKLQQCPIYLNRQVLNNDNVLRHIADLFEIAKDDGLHFTLRHLMVVIANAILGSTTKTSRRFHTCNTVKSDIGVNFDSVHQYAEDRRSSPFDNLLGLNLQNKVFKSSMNDNGNSCLTSSPVYVHLDTFGVGKHSNKMLDNFLTNGSIDSNHPAHDAMDSNPMLTEFNQLVKQFDVAHINEKLALRFAHIQSEAYNEGQNSNNDIKLIRSYIASLRRIMFFNADEDSDKRSLACSDNISGLSSYALTSFKYAKNYLELKKVVNQTLNLADKDELSPTINQLIVGVNRAFTSLPSISDTDVVHITSNNRINPAAFCINPDKRRYSIHFNPYADAFTNCIKIVSSSILKDTRCIPTIVYFGNEKANTTASTVQPTEKSEAEIKQHFSTEVLEYIEDLKNDKHFKRNLKSINYPHPLESMQLNELIECCYKYLDDDDLDESEQKAKAEIHNYLNLSRDSLSCDELIAIPDRYNPSIGARLYLSPRVFEYLMSLGAGIQGISFSNECYAEITAFKTSIDAYITRLDRDTSNEVNNKSYLTNLEFGAVNSEGKISFT